MRRIITRILRWSLIAMVLVVIALAIAWPQRRLLALRMFALVFEPPPLAEPGPEPDSVTWFEDYFTVEAIDPQTFAIGEPRYWQENYSYLILGEARGLLFDSGSGVRDIKPVVESLTDLPITVVSSHLHYDHTGNHQRFERLAHVDLPWIRERTRDGRFRPSAAEHLGFFEKREAQTLSVTEWWDPDERVDLGGRTITVLHAPGHTPESIVLLDDERKLLFTGDYIYEGTLLANLPGSDLNDYLRTARRLAERIAPGTRLLTAHRGSQAGAPILSPSDLLDLRSALERARAGTLEGEGSYRRTFPVNDRIRLEAEMPWPEAEEGS